MKTSRPKSAFQIVTLLSLLVSLISGAIFTTPARALTLTVTNTNNSGAGSLRQALLDANNSDVIDATGISGTITLVSELVVNDDVTINGPGAASLTVSGNDTVRVFSINTGKTVVINNLTVAHGKVVDAHGAGINNLGSLTLDHVVVSNNTVAKGSSDFLRGGGIHSYDGSSLTVTNSTVSGNTARQNGGGIDVEFNATVYLENVIIDDNHLSYYGSVGGGINIRQGTTATLDKVTISNNSAFSGGGGLYSDTTLVIANSLIANNSALTNQSSGGDGGGISFNAVGQTFTLTNVTISGNSADNTNNNARGGGIVLWAGTLNLNNVTIAGNTAESTGGGFHAELGGSAIVNMRNTLISGNTASATPADCYGNTNSLGYNLIKNVTCTITGNTTGNITGSDPKLAALADNGGPTKSMALMAGSPAINAGTNTSCPATDQRGVARPQGAYCDIGSYEKPIITLTLKSTGAQDGWILESTETSNIGGTLNTAAQTFNLGDDAAKKQYRAILSFSTGAGLPDNAVVSKVTLRVKKSASVGKATFAMFQGLLADVKKGYLGANANLASTDFQAKASTAGKTYGPFSPALVSSWYSVDLTAGKAYINKLATLSGLTQIRLRFKLDDNNNAIANYISFYSGNAAVAANRPQLAIQYYVP